MPRTGRRRSLTIAAALLAMLAAPAAAQAATYTVKIGAGPCGGADLECGGMGDAATAAVAGDVFNVEQGIYGSATFDVGGVTIAGAPAFTVNGTLAFSSNSGAVSKLQKCAINQNVGAGNGVVVSGTAGLEISDCVILSNNGDGVVISAGATNKIVRSVIGSAGTVTAAVKVTSPETPDTKKLVLESTVLVGADGLSVNTGLGNGLECNERQRRGRAASRHRRRPDARPRPRREPGEPAHRRTCREHHGHGGRLDHHERHVQGELPRHHARDRTPANTVTDTYTRTLQVPAMASPAAVFVNPVNRNYRLRAGSPAINAGGVTAGESPTDIDGQDRSTAPTDQGADEYVAPPPGTTPPPPAPGASNDGLAPAVVITKPSANQRINIYRRGRGPSPSRATARGSGSSARRASASRVSFAGTAKDARASRASC